VRRVAASILTNALVAAVGRVLNVGLGIAAVAILTRSLGPDTFGFYVLLFSLGTVIQLAGDLGLYLTLTREIAQRPQAEAEVVAHIVSLRLVALIVLFGVVIVGSIVAPLSGDWVAALCLFALGFIFQSLSQLTLGVYQHHQSVWPATVGDLVGRCLQLLALWVWVREQPSGATAAAAFMMSTALALVVHVWLLPRHYWPWRYHRETWLRLLRAGAPLGAVLLLNALYFRLDTFILAWWRPTIEVGWYGAAYRIIESALFFPAMFGGLLLPRLSETFGKKTRAAVQYLTESMYVVIVVASLGLVVLLIRGREIIILLSGESFSPAGPLLQILALALFCMCFGNIFGFALVAAGRQRSLLVLSGALVFVALLVDVLLIPRWGAVGAAWATVITEAAASSTAAFLVWRLLPFSLPWRWLGRVGAAAFLTAWMLMSLPPSVPVVVQLVIATLGYGVMSFFLGTLTRRHLNLLRSSHAPV
jgi:O-antigen/teichoic acid export membrane protein